MLLQKIIDDVLLKGKFQRANGSAFLGIFNSEVVMYSLLDHITTNKVQVEAFISVSLNEYVDDPSIQNAVQFLKDNVSPEDHEKFLCLRLTDDANMIYDAMLPEHIFCKDFAELVSENSPHLRAYPDITKLEFSLDVGMHLPESSLLTIIQTGMVVCNTSDRHYLRSIHVRDNYVIVTDGHRLLAQELPSPLTQGCSAEYYLPLLKEMYKGFSVILSLNGYYPETYNCSDKDRIKPDVPKSCLVIEGITKVGKDNQLFIRTGCVINARYPDAVRVCQETFDTSNSVYALPLNVVTDLARDALAFYQNLIIEGASVKVARVLCLFEFKSLSVRLSAIAISDEYSPRHVECISREMYIGPKDEYGNHIPHEYGMPPGRVYSYDCKYLNSLDVQVGEGRAFFPNSELKPLVMTYSNGLKSMLMPCKQHE